MGRYNEELAKAGVLLDPLGLQPTSRGAGVTYSGSKRAVTDGPVRRRPLPQISLDYQARNQPVDHYQWSAFGRC